MSEIPTKWFVAEVAWGEGKRHLYLVDNEAIEVCKTEAGARKEAEEWIRNGSKMVALLEIKTLLVPKPVEYEAIT